MEERGRKWNWAEEDVNLAHGSPKGAAVTLYVCSNWPPLYPSITGCEPSAKGGVVLGKGALFSLGTWASEVVVPPAAGKYIVPEGAGSTR